MKPDRQAFKDQAIARRAIADLDVETARRHWASMFPGQAMVDDSRILAMLHLARTMTPGIADRLRFYSHRWLVDHNLPSFLPDPLKAKAEREYPVTVTGVGIAVRFGSPLLKPIGDEVAAAMSSAVLEAHADGKLDDVAHVRRRMAQAKAETMGKLIGIKAE